MNDFDLRVLVEQNLSIAQIATRMNCSKGNVRYWLNKFNLKTVPRVDPVGHKTCPMCHQLKPIEDFHKRRNNQSPSSYCKLCTTIQTNTRQKELKIKCVEYKGGVCTRCLYDKYVGALEFHHVDPTKKDFSLAKYKRYVFNDVVKKELDTCILLCSNCHREVHHELRLSPP